MSAERIPFSSTVILDSTTIVHEKTCTFTNSRNVKITVKLTHNTDGTYHVGSIYPDTGESSSCQMPQITSLAEAFRIFDSLMTQHR